MSSPSTPAKPTRPEGPSPASAAPRKRRSSATEDVTQGFPKRHVRAKHSSKTHRSSKDFVTRQDAHRAEVLAEAPDAEIFEDRCFRRYHDHTRSDRFLILSFFDLMERPCTEVSQATIHLSGLVEPLGYTRLGYTDGILDGRRRRILSCEVCGSPVFDDHALFQTRYPERILHLIHQFLHNQRRRMSCPSGEGQEDHEEFFKVVPQQVRHIVALLTHWASLEPYDSSGQLKERWRSRIRGLLEQAPFHPISLHPGQILIFREHEALFKAFFVIDGADHGVFGEANLQVVHVKSSTS